MSEENVNKNYWTCIVGPTDKSKLENSADVPMRRAVDKAFNETVGHDYEIMWSGWGATQERADILNAVWSMEQDDPIFVELVAMLKRSKRMYFTFPNEDISFA
jgi:hypothetical protein